MKKRTTISNWIEETHEWVSPIAREQVLSAEINLVDALEEMKNLIDQTLFAYEQGGLSAWHGIRHLSSSFHNNDVVIPIASRITKAVVTLRACAELTVRKEQGI